MCARLVLRQLPDFVGRERHEDLIADAEVLLIEAIDSYNPRHGASVATWIKRVILWRLWDSVRRREMREALHLRKAPRFASFRLSPDPAPDALAASAQRVLAVRQAVDELAASHPREAEIARRFYFGAEQIAAIAPTMGVTHGRASQLNARARKRLAVALEALRDAA